MIPIVLASVVTAAMAGFVLYGLTRIFRKRKIHMVDYPELPAPGDDNAPTRQA